MKQSRTLMLAATLLLILPLATSAFGAGASEHENVRCSTFSFWSRQCFFHCFTKKGAAHEKCMTRSQKCKDCNEAMFKCWRTLTSKSQCGTCGKEHDKCFRVMNQMK